MPCATDATSIDSLIVGHGLAGAILAHKLIERGQQICVISEQTQNDASRVAAGIINPVTGHRLNITENFEIFHPNALRFYQEFSKTFGVEVYRSITQQRLIKNPGQHDYLQKRITEPVYQNLLGTHSHTPNHFTKAEYGYVEIHKSGLLDTNVLLDVSINNLKQRGALKLERFEPSKLSVDSHACRYDNISAKRIVFCEGYQAINNPWLNHLPFKLAKGEIIDIELEQDLQEFLNWGHWLAPQTDKNYARLGASHEWNDLSFEASSTQKIIDSLTTRTRHRGKVLNVQVGIRPTTTHRKPFIGALKNLSNAYCFNGFGSKGCLLMPYYADLLCEHLMQHKPLPNEVTQWL